MEPQKNKNATHFFRCCFFVGKACYGNRKNGTGRETIESGGNFCWTKEMRVLSVGGEKNNPDMNISRLLRHSTKPGCEDGI